LSEQFRQEQAQRLKAEQSLQDGKGELDSLSEQYQQEQQARLKAEQSLQDSKGELDRLSEQLRQEQAQRLKAEQSLQDSQREVALISEQRHLEEEQRQKREQSLEETKSNLNELTAAANSESSQTHAHQESQKSQEFEEQIQPTTLYIIKSVSSGKCLQGSSKNTTTPISQDIYRGGRNQQWHFQQLGGVDQGYYHIFSVRTQKCLDVSSKTKENKKDIYQHQCQGVDNQKWKLMPASDESFVIQCKQTGKVLTVSEETDKIIQEMPQNTDNQCWILAKMTL